MAEHVLALTLGLDERGFPPGAATRVHLVAEVTATGAGVERDRPPLSVVLAVDVSGSMAGPPIEQVIQSIDRLLGLLAPTDRVGLVTFSDGAAEVAPLAPADASARRLINARARRLIAEGGTNVEAGLRRAAALFPARAEHERQAVLLLSDGAPNRGLSSAEGLADLARSLRPDIGVSTLGYGAQHNEDLLRAVSDGGAGQYHFIADPAVCELEFAQAIGAQGDVVAEAIELGLAPEKGVEILRFLGKPSVRYGGSGLRVDVPDLMEGSRRAIVAELAITTPREPGRWKMMRATLTYRRAGERAPLALSELLSADVGLIDRVVDAAARARVLLARVDEARGEARALADRGQFDGAAAVLRKMLQAAQAEPWFKAGDGSPLAEAVEQLLDEAVALERRPSREEYRTLRKTQLTVPMSSEAPHKASTPMSVSAMHSVAGPLPPAALVVQGGRDAGRRYPLGKPKAVIGRTTGAEIQVDSPNISRQHAMIAGQAGRYVVLDLGSTNTTQVNGQAVGRPHPLVPGDVIRVGDVELRYEEDPR